MSATSLSIFDIPRAKPFVFSESEKPIIMPYFALSKQQDLMKLMLDPSMLRDIESQVKVKSCITSQVIFLVQAYLRLLINKSQELKQPIDVVLSEFKIGIIGCGVIGKSILNALAFLLGWIPANNIHISTRRPENLSKYEEIGFNIYFDNEKLIEQCDVIIWSFPPSLDNWAAIEVKNALKSRVANSNGAKLLKPLVISVVSNLHVSKLENLMLVQGVFVRSNISQKVQLSSEEKSFAESLFSETELIQEVLSTYHSIFKEVIPKSKFNINSIDNNVRVALLGNSTTTFENTPDLIAQASSYYVREMENYQQKLPEVLFQRAPYSNFNPNEPEQLESHQVNTTNSSNS